MAVTNDFVLIGSNDFTCSALYGSNLDYLFKPPVESARAASTAASSRSFETPMAR